jgi:hypothetical protein
MPPIFFSTVAVFVRSVMMILSLLARCALVGLVSST